MTNTPDEPPRVRKIVEPELEDFLGQSVWYVQDGGRARSGVLTNTYVNRGQRPRKVEVTSEPRPGQTWKPRAHIHASALRTGPMPEQPEHFPDEFPTRSAAADQPRRIKVIELDSYYYRQVWYVRRGEVRTGILSNTTYSTPHPGRHVLVDQPGAWGTGHVVRASELWTGPPALSSKTDEFELGPDERHQLDEL